MIKKMLNAFKSKKFIKIFSLVLAGVIALTTSLCIILPSYLNYKKYYDALMAEKEHEKYLESLKLDLLSISAQLDDGVELFEGDLPTNDDFFVKAQFTEKGKNFEKILSPNDFNLTIPTDFETNGGKVEISYSWTPEKEEGATADPTPVVKTAQVDISLSRTATATSTLEAENAVSVGGVKNTVDAYICANETYSKIGSALIMQNFTEGNSLTFNVESSGVARAKASIVLANSTSANIKLADVISLRVNGKYVSLYDTYLTAEPSQYACVFTTFNLPDLVLNKGANSIVLNFKSGAEGIAFDKLNLETQTRGATISKSTAKEFGLSVGEYAVSCVDNGATARFSATPAIGTNGKVETNKDYGIYAMGGASDGDYLYFAMDTTNNLKTYLYKVDAKDYSIVARSKPFTVATASGDNARLFIKDDVLYCFAKDGSLFSINVKDFNGMDTCTVEKNNLSFASCGTAKDAVWVESIGKFALLTTDSKLHVLDEELTPLISAVSLSSTVGGVSSLTADEKFIYVNYNNDGTGTIPVDVYTWDGVKVNTFMVGNFQLFPISGSLAFNTQALFLHNGNLHLSVCGWGTDSKYYHDWIISIG